MGAFPITTILVLVAGCLWGEPTEDLGMSENCPFKEKTMADCKACGDNVPDRKIHKQEINGHIYCRECYRELKYGEIKISNVTFFPGGKRAPIKEDDDPWLQVAVRRLEDG